MSVRPCERNDLDQVAKIFVETFPDGWGSSEDELIQYVSSIYLDNPWASDKFPSLVFEKSGTIEGFVGVVPRKMLFQGDEINVLVPSAFMVKQASDGVRNPFAAVCLLRQLLAGKQDLTITDTANASSRDMWTKSGGVIAHPHTYNWLRPLQPFSAGLVVASQFLPRVLQLMGYPFARLGDIVHSCLPINSLGIHRPEGLQISELDSPGLIEAASLLPEFKLSPVYDLESLNWQFEQAEKNNTDGGLSKYLVRDEKKKTIGWFVYYRNRKSVGRVLQLVATHPTFMNDVFDCLLSQAKSEGLAALWGRAMPVFPDLAAQRLCLFMSKPYVLAHSPNPDIIQTVLKGEMLFTGLEGEDWMIVNSWD